MIFNLHIHKWSVWSNPLENYSGHKRQWRKCLICNKIQHSTLGWDGQTKIKELTTCLDSLDTTIGNKKGI